MLIERTPQGILVLSELCGGYLVTRRYIGYTKQEAIQQFKQELQDEKRDIQNRTSVLPWRTSESCEDTY